MNTGITLDDELADYLAANGFGTVGNDIFLDEMPPDIDGALLIVSMTGSAPEKYIDTEYPVFEFWYRSKDTAAGKAFMERLARFLHRRGHYQPADNWYVYYSKQLGSVSNRGSDSMGSKLLQVSIQFMCRNLNYS